MLARLPRVRDRARQGGPVPSARSKMGVSRSTLAVGLQHILRGNASAWALGFELAIAVKNPSQPPPAWAQLISTGRVEHSSLVRAATAIEPRIDPARIELRLADRLASLPAALESFPGSRSGADPLCTLPWRKVRGAAGVQRRQSHAGMCGSSMNKGVCPRHRRRRVSMRH